MTEISGCKSLGRSQWPRSLRRGSAVRCVLVFRVRMLPGQWICVCCECCVWSGGAICDEPITSPEDSYRLF